MLGWSTGNMASSVSRVSWMPNRLVHSICPSEYANRCPHVRHHNGYGCSLSRRRVSASSVLPSSAQIGFPQRGHFDQGGRLATGFALANIRLVAASA